MKHNPILRQRVIKNYKKYTLQFQEKLPWLQTWAKIKPDVLYDLLEGVSGQNESKANQLLKEMSCAYWQIRATVHKGGHGGAGWLPDQSPHITVRVARTTYHLHCRVNNSQLHVYDIT